MKRPAIRLLRNVHAAALAETFLVSAAATVVIVRVFLYVTGYPQIAGAGLHIAHMLWGGLLMAIALFLLLFLLNPRVRHLSSFIGGIGFGLFIDELGKFITADNDYWFRPTYALIYVIFILLYFAIRKVFITPRFSSTEYITNALDMLKEIVANDFSIEEKRHALRYLEHAEQEGRDVKGLKQFINSAEVTGHNRPSRFAIISQYIHKQYVEILEQPWFQRSFVYLFILIVIINIFFLALTLLPFVVTTPHMTFVVAYMHRFRFFDWGLLVSALIANIMILSGVVYYRRSYAKSFQLLKNGVLVSILLTGFFNFYHNQLSAVIGILANAVVLYGLNYMIRHRKRAPITEA